MNGPQLLEEHIGRLVTRMGAIFPGERAVFRGQDLFTSLGDLDWLELYAFSITGRRYTPQQMRVLHVIWTHTSYPDARLWNNRVAALAGTARSTGSLGIAAALAVSEAQIYGGVPQLRCCEFLTRAKIMVDEGADLEALVHTELKEKRGIGGYGRPIVPTDERIAPTMAIVREQGLENGPHLKLAFEVERILLEGRWRMHMNIVGLDAAICADFGMSPREFNYFFIPVFLAGMPPCYLDAAEKPEGLLFPLPCRVMLYEGVSHRPWRSKTPNI
ncbi:MAG: citryl-CoA lyase [Gallionellales bacterium RIFCSPLOWO2_02_FULL_57_47]|nr:MAG: citryl-CoA lyase [Gallionellales bacterium RIFCSPLOWO2_02_FULL_57_47]